ncbi:Fe-only nitrogenase accessory AnfO family protein [Pararhodospirillum oryzae]|uniref:Uncharacterized protein n=1 Tax=Pararhodospirillum oryzae TaxID=478448 RepID=A0A512H895_9PROT|nr:Fe-only nitrogenase accessory AnfO family protein [Pararhodospirillum oryzae]GEO81662.1 hypothetical protein ROR02_17930 [Pararhodospirillum oryzae]
MHIAVFVDRLGTPAPLLAAHGVRLYQGSPGAWALRREILVSLEGSGTGLASLQAALRPLPEQLENCRIFLATHAPGIAAAFFQEALGARLWAVPGSLPGILDIVARHEATLAAAQPAAPVAPAAPAASCASSSSCVSGPSCSGRSSGGLVDPVARCRRPRRWGRGAIAWTWAPPWPAIRA